MNQVENDTSGLLQCHPYPGDFSDESRSHHYSYFVGLQRKKGISAQDGQQQFDIRRTVVNFKHQLCRYSCWKSTMWINVCHVRRKNIPLFVSSGGIQPSQPAKVSSGSCSARRLLGQSSFQTDDAVSRKRRKQNEVNEGAHLEESSSSSMSSGLLGESRGRKQIESDVADSMSNADCPKNIIGHCQGLEGSLKCRLPVAPSASGLAGASPEKCVIEQSSKEIVSIVSNQISSNAVYELKNEADMNIEPVEKNSFQSSIIKQAVALTIAGKGGDNHCSKILQNEGLEELEVLSANIFYYFLFVTITLLSFCPIFSSKLLFMNHNLLLDSLLCVAIFRLSCILFTYSDGDAICVID